MAGLERTLDPVEVRILGCLVEKELSTPDGYPLSLASLLAACNQSSNRDPVVALETKAIEESLRSLMANVLVWRERGARTLRWKHQLDSKLVLDRPAKAILAELMLRGPQTPGELRSRCTRMHTFAGLAEVEATLQSLAARGLVAGLPRAPGQKERRWRQLLGKGEPRRPEASRKPLGERATAAADPAPSRSDVAQRLSSIEAQVAELARRLERLERAHPPAEEPG